jgi:hypothetical protein
MGLSGVVAFLYSSLNRLRESALKEVLRRKQKGERIERPKEPSRTNVVNLMDALRRSDGNPSIACSAPAASGGTLLDFNPPDYREFVRSQKEKWESRNKKSGVATTKF